ncbi:MAG: nucleoside triphosphate pyrophosphohydrolase [Pseudobdellovibrionaceae bacterium]
MNQTAINTSAPSSLTRLLEVMTRLRDPKTGCPWDIEQNFQTIAPYTIEEAYEVADAIERGDMTDLKQELGDLLLQVIFHSQMAKEENLFDFHDVTEELTEKLISRHPHVFGDAEASKASDVLTIWEARKDAEKAEKSPQDGPDHMLNHITKGLPSLMRAHKIQAKAAKTGFDWTRIEDILDKVDEELQELKDAIASQDRAHIEEEFGDLLFVLANIGRNMDIPAEDALRKANEKFIRRFNGMEKDSYKDGKEFSALSLDEMNAYWEKQKAKK